MGLAALSDFNLVATHGGFGRASRSSGRSKATLSRRVSELEARLGVRLIERGSRTLRLTDEGRALHELTQGPLADIAEAEQAVAAGSSIPKGKLRVSAPIVLAHVLLPKVAAAFVQAYPQVALEIIAEDRLVDPIEDNYDLVIRVDPRPDERLVGRRIVEDERLLVARSDVRVALGRAHEDLVESTPAVGRSATPEDVVWSIATKDGIRVVNPKFRLRFSSLLMVRGALLSGAGCALMPKLLVESDVAAGRLVSWGTQDSPKVEIWALQNTRRLSSTKIRAFLEALAALD